MYKVTIRLTNTMNCFTVKESKLYSILEFLGFINLGKPIMKKGRYNTEYWVVYTNTDPYEIDHKEYYLERIASEYDRRAKCENNAANILREMKSLYI